MCLFYIYFVTLLVPSSACQNWECNCVDEVACSIYIYLCRCCLEVHLSTQLCLPTGSVLVWAKSLFDTYMCVWCIYVLPLFVYPTPLASLELIVWTMSRARYIYVPVHLVFKYICLLNFACRQGVCLCGESRYLIRIHVSNIYVYCHYSSNQFRLPTGSVIVWTKSRAQCMYLHLWILSLPYIHIVHIWYVSVCLIYIYILSLFVSVGTYGLEMWIWANVTSVGMARTASKRDERKTRLS